MNITAVKENPAKNMGYSAFPGMRMLHMAALVRALRRSR